MLIFMLQYLVPVLVMAYTNGMIAFTLWKKREIGEVNKIGLEAVFCSLKIVRYYQTATIKISGPVLTAPNKEEPDAEVKAQGIKASLDYDVAVVASNNGWNFL